MGLHLNGSHSGTTNILTTDTLHVLLLNGLKDLNHGNWREWLLENFNEHNHHYFQTLIGGLLSGQNWVELNPPRGEGSTVLLFFWVLHCSRQCAVNTNYSRLCDCAVNKLQSTLYYSQHTMYDVSTMCSVQCLALQKWGEADSPPGEKEARQREEASQGTALALSAILHFSASGAAIKTGKLGNFSPNIYLNWPKSNWGKKNEKKWIKKSQCLHYGKGGGPVSWDKISTLIIFYGSL